MKNTYFLLKTSLMVLLSVGYFNISAQTHIRNQNFSDSRRDPNKKQNVPVVQVSQQDFDKMPDEQKKIIKENPQRFKVVPLKHKISATEFQTMPQNKKDHIQANPDLYEIVPN